MSRLLALAAMGALLLLAASAPLSQTVRGGVSGIVLEKTVVVDDTPDDDTDDVCGTETSITVVEGTVVDYCFEITNESDDTLDTHDLVDSELGTLLTDFPYTLVPDASAFLTQGATIDATVTNTATWTATDGTVTYDDSASATVTVSGSAVTLSKTVMIDTGVEICEPLLTSIVVPAGTQVRYCFEITNNSNQTLDTHDLVDSELGALLTDFPYMLVPGASAFLTETEVITTTVTNTATWTASVDTSAYSDEASATVTVPAASAPPASAPPASAPPASASPTASPTVATSPSQSPATGLLPDTALGAGSAEPGVGLAVGAAVGFLGLAATVAASAIVTSHRSRRSSRH